LNLSEASDGDPTVKIQKGVLTVDRVRVLASKSGEVHWRWTAAMFWRSLDDGETTTGFRRIRRARPFDRCRGLRPGEGEGHGWSGAGDGELWVLDDDIVLWRFEPNQVVRELH
jgi:hypothetical protein